MFQSIFDYLGFFGPHILLVTSIFLLRNKNTLLYVYIIGVFSSSIINYILKGLIKCPRPSENVHVFNMELNNELISGRRMGFDRFGMPSGHAQSVFFSLVFIYLALKNTKISLFYLFICLVTIYQRLKYNDHSLLQLVVASIIGSFISFAFYKYAKHILKNSLKEKPDDGAFQY